jgi:hypothetical protein
VKGSDLHVLGRLAVIEMRVRTAVQRRRQVDPDPDDGFKGLYLADHHVDALLDASPSDGEDPATGLLADVEAAASDESRLRRLVATFGLSDLDIDLLLIAMAPDLDARFEKLYGYLHDDVTQRRATTGLALELAGASTTDAAARGRFDAAAPLVRNRLLSVEGNAPALRRVLRVPDRVTSHLLGHDEIDAGLIDLTVPAVGASPQDAAPLARVVGVPGNLVFIRQEAGSAPRELAVAGLNSAGMPAVVLDLRRVPANEELEELEELAKTAGREALLRGGGLVAGPLEPLVERGPEIVRAFSELPCTTLLYGFCNWDPSWSRSVAILAEAVSLNTADRAELWASSLNGNRADGLDPAAATRQFRFGPEGLQRAAVAAQQQAALAGERVGVPQLLHGARSQNAVGLETLARRISPAVGWDQLILPAGAMSSLKELSARARHRETVLDEWQMRPGGGRGRGITALFAGDSGTGKTLAAEVLAGDLGLDLYTVDLATVVDKYIGETEKNLERIFSEADGVNGVLLFDEADALFGKRSEVKDARDRYANIEVAYLLQRMESFNGLAILATNLRTNLDDAFARRLDTIVDFPNPEAEDRLRLWDLCLGPHLPRADDIDFDFMARAFELTGGHIRSICVTAAYLAADAGRPVSMSDIIRATQQEYRKLGRLVLEAEFGSWLTFDGQPLVSGIEG